MREQNRPLLEQTSGPGGLGDIFNAEGDGDRTATVASGPYAYPLPVAGSTVGEVRARFRDRLDIPPHSQATLDGEDVDDSTVVRAGQVLMFVQRAGEKGRAVAALVRARPIALLAASARHREAVSRALTSAASIGSAT